MITLRKLEPSDLPFLYQWENDADAWADGANHNPLSQHDLREYIAASTGDIYRDGQHIGWSESSDFVDFSAVQGQAYTYTVTGKTTSVESNPTNSVYVDWTTGIDENGSEKNVRLYPNPTESQVTIEGQGLRQVRVFNVTGQEIEHRDLSGSQAVIDLSNAPKGCYFVEVTSESGCTTSKIMKL